jgi:hypothetical protein
MGLRVLRRGETPHCRRCDYALTGLASPERCPECGAVLGAKRAVAHGERYRRRGLAWAGVALLLLGGTPVTLLLVGRARNYDWYRWRPTAWVLNDLQGTGTRRAMRELQRRYADGSLTRGEKLDRFVAFALGEQARATTGLMTDEAVDFLGDAVTKGDLSAADVSRFYRNAAPLTLSVAPTAIAGKPVPWKVDEACRVPGGRMWVDISNYRVAWDGRFPPDKGDEGGGYSRLSGPGAGGSTSNSIRAPNSPGPHVLTLKARVSVFKGDMDDTAAKPLEKHDVTLEAKVGVRPGPPG